MADDIRQLLMAKHCPSFIGFSPEVGMPLARSEQKIINVECSEITPRETEDVNGFNLITPIYREWSHEEHAHFIREIDATNERRMAQLSQKIDGNTAFVQQGFEHLIKQNEVFAKQNQSFDARLSQLEAQRSQPVATQPIIQYQQPQQPQTDLMPVFHQLYAQQQNIAAIANQNNQTNLAIAQLTGVMQKLAERPVQPTVVNHYVDNTVHNDNHSVEIHGDNYGNICTEGVQRNGASFWMFMGVAILTMIVGSKIYGK
jgi:hypothetical protein